MKQEELVQRLMQNEVFAEYVTDRGNLQVVASSAVGIWKGYRKIFQSQYVLRSGYALYGCVDSEMPTTRPQSVAEHQYLTTMLILGIFQRAPVLFDSDQQRLLMDVMLWHDLGEITVGDIPDDGSISHETKLHQEEVALLEIMECFGGSYGKELEIIQMKSRLGDKKNDVQWLKSNKRMARFVHLADKISALLDLCCYEDMGQPGDIEHKRIRSVPTDRDIRSAEKTGSGRPLDIWTYSLIMISRLRDGYDYDMLFEGILRAAVLDVRSEGMPWMDRVLHDGTF